MPKKFNTPEERREYERELKRRRKETKTPETKTPETKTPEPEPETKTPETKTPEPEPETKTPETKTPETKTPDWAMVSALVKSNMAQILSNPDDKRVMLDLMEYLQDQLVPADLFCTDSYAQESDSDSDTYDYGIYSTSDESDDETEMKPKQVFPPDEFDYLGAGERL